MEDVTDGLCRNEVRNGEVIVYCPNLGASKGKEDWEMVFLTAAAEQPQGSVLAMFLPFIIMLVVFYVFIIRPQQKQQKERQNMLNSLKKGDKVVTVGGIYGEISAIKDDELSLRVADKVEIRISRSGVGRVQR